MRTGLIALALILALCAPAEARQARSKAVLREFRAAHECPSTGLKTGPCPEQIDHRWPLCAGGADSPENLRYLSVPDHKAKTKLDIKGCNILRSARK